MSRPGRLLQVLGVAFGLAIIVGNSIGVGIFRTPGDIATQLPDPKWFLGVWLVGGLYALVGALSLAELGAMVPESGGQYVFARRALGDYPGFVVGWSDWVSSCGSMALVTIAVGEYAGELVPALAPYAVAISCVVVIVFTVIHGIGIHSSDAVQQATSLVKVIVLGALAAACWLAAPPHTASAEAAVSTGIPSLAALAIALQGVIYTYDGWNGMLYFSGEVKNPGRDIPRAMAGGVVMIIAIYLALNLTYLRVLSPEEMAGQKLAAGAVAAAAFGPIGEAIVRAVIIASLMSAASAILLLSTRVPYALSKDGLLPPALSRVSLKGSPTTSLAFSAALPLLMILTGTFEQVLAVTAFFFVLNYTLSFVSLFVLRRREPDTPRPYRAWGFPWSTGLLVVGSIAFFAAQVYGDTRNSLWAMAALAFSYPLYRVVRGRRTVPGGAGAADGEVGA
ncbi:MAG TPA: APC family permease [Gemmatimonadales bacterium]|nr:APC family permease [Gemmatimonadales bacterium]